MNAKRHEEDVAGSDLELSSLSSSDSFEPQAFEGGPVELKSPSPIRRLETQESFETTRRVLDSVSSNPTIKEQAPAENEKPLVVGGRTNQELPSETLESLQKDGLDLQKKGAADVIGSMTNGMNCEFPEEYNIETDTGLVKAVTLQQLNRLESRTSMRSGASQRRSVKSSIASLELPDSTSLKSSGTSSLDPEKLRRAVEKNQKQLEKYQKRKKSKGITGLLSKLFG
ncbi:LADA_0B04610g1_1 [Lachancea dasiensis]|uniref:LADA_0B04610g1_1 n=1 Tax=Lachancea dasiensis TaxID=1072105 RepID=A0A1G4ITC1_9SACH|nr:LADA_0B04610g1_1 [Lachancea dasiensis]